MSLTTYNPDMTSSMGMPSTDNPALLRKAQITFIICEILNVIMIFMVLWILSSVVMYGIQKGKWKKKFRKSDVNGGMVYTAALVAVVATLPRFLMEQVIFNAGNLENPEYYCEVIMDTGNAMYFVGLYPIYLFLWFRQRALYGHPAMTRLTGKFVRLFSWATLFVLSGAAVAVASFFVYPVNYTYSVEGCVSMTSLVNSTSYEQANYQRNYYVLAGLLLVSQVCLLGLFIYPMARSNMIMKHNSRAASRKTSRATSTEAGNTDVLEMGDKSRSKSNLSAAGGINPNKIMQSIRHAGRRVSKIYTAKGRNSVEITIRRSVIFAALSMFSDISALAVVTLVSSREVSRSLTNTIYDISMMLSVFCVLASFESYRDILTVFCKARTYGGSETFTGSTEDNGKYSRRSSEKSISLSVSEKQN